MDKKEYWNIIQEVIDSGEKDTEKRNYKLAEKLRKRTVKDILLFDDITSRYKGQLWNDVDLNLSSMGFSFTDSGFDYFTVWLIAQGEETFNAVINESTHMRVLIPANNRLPENPDFLGVPEDAYNQKRKELMDGIDDALDDENRLILLMEDDYYNAFTKVKR